jgi:hypothetical protein
VLHLWTSFAPRLVGRVGVFWKEDEEIKKLGVDMCIDKVWDEMKQALLNVAICLNVTSNDHETHHLFSLIFILLNGSRIVEVKLFMFNNLYENCSILF